MKCNMTECYWNLYNPKREHFNKESAKQCVSEDMEEHCDENDDFKLIPNSSKCPSYKPYIEFCGRYKGE